MSNDGKSTDNNITLTENSKLHNEDKTQLNYIGDDMEGDVIEQYNGDKTIDENHLRSKSSMGDNKFAQMGNLEEYQGYPNEADLIDKSSLSTRDKKKKDYSTLRTMKDAIAVDDSLIDNELKALDQEDLKIGNIIFLLKQDLKIMIF